MLIPEMSHFRQMPILHYLQQSFFLTNKALKRLRRNWLWLTALIKRCYSKHDDVIINGFVWDWFCGDLQSFDCIKDKRCQWPGIPAVFYFAILLTFLYHLVKRFYNLLICLRADSSDRVRILWGSPASINWSLPQFLSWFCTVHLRQAGWNHGPHPV